MIFFLYTTIFGLLIFCLEFFHLGSQIIVAFSFLILLLSGFGIKDMLISWNELGVSPSIFSEKVSLRLEQPIP